MRKCLIDRGMTIIVNDVKKTSMMDAMKQIMIMIMIRMIMMMMTKIM